MKKKEQKKIGFFKALSNFEVLKEEFEDLEFLVFRSGKSYYPSLIEYRLDKWRNRKENLSRWTKFWNLRSLRDLETREISIRSRLIIVEKIEKELNEEENRKE